MKMLGRIAALIILCLFLNGCNGDAGPEGVTTSDRTRTTIEHQDGSAETRSDISAETKETETFSSASSVYSTSEDETSEFASESVTEDHARGSSHQPASPGEMIRVIGILDNGDEYQFTITPGQAITGDAAMAELKEQNSYNDVSSGGSPFIIPVSVTVETWPASSADLLYIYHGDFASHFADNTDFEPADAFVHNDLLAGEVLEGDTLEGVLIFTASLWNDHLYVVFDDSIWWEYPIEDTDVLSGETRPQESMSELPGLGPHEGRGTQDDPLTEGESIELSLETYYGEADLTISIDSIWRGEAARIRAAEENSYNLFDDNQDAVFIDVTVTVDRLDQTNDIPLLIYAAEHFVPFDSSYEPYEDGTELAYYDELFHYFNEGVTETGTIAMMIPRGETTYFLFYDRIWIEVPTE